MEIQLGKEGMKNSQFNAQLGVTKGCTLRLLLNGIPPEKQAIKHGMVRTLGLAVYTLHGHEGIF
jgi:hypothetical protein